MSDDDAEIEAELLVTLHLRFPNGDRPALAAHLAPIFHAAIAAGGRSLNMSVLPYSPDADGD